ncbi:8-oxo-dGTP diphosphatase [Haladaptatus litoreus]|uniref:8-oxo-dGTP diphosphatase n=1 Tax=Haladaptatus litoreus TaxID=553468 RepID=A0A1N7EMB1_9EURY|nr:NUDIX domain-containing protein [Haladaptatus litoreus]SIR89055.1 8-oxo-dGTP diphosphatase [Haladaptatus litoreus]
MLEEYGYVVNVDGVVVKGDEYLFIERGENEDHAAGLLSFPGGKVEQPPGSTEALEKTAARELYEEVGIEIGDIEYVCSTTFEADDSTRCLNIVVLCEYISGDAYPRATDEVAAVHWLSYDEIKARTDVPGFVERFVDCAEEARNSA